MRLLRADLEKGLRTRAQPWRRARRRAHFAAINADSISPGVPRSARWRRAVSPTEIVTDDQDFTHEAEARCWASVTSLRLALRGCKMDEAAHEKRTKTPTTFLSR
jgi:hypothetical protein